jgi:hypothetical protein
MLTPVIGGPANSSESFGIEFYMLVALRMGNTGPRLQSGLTRFPVLRLKLYEKDISFWNSTLLPCVSYITSGNLSVRSYVSSASIL